MAEADDTSYYAHHGSMLRELCAMNAELPNIVQLDRRLDIADLGYLVEVEHFDVVLALLVVHLMDERLREQVRILDLLLRLSDHLIVEIANDVGVRLSSYVEYLEQALDARLLGEVKRHKDPHSVATGRLISFTRADRSPSRSARPDAAGRGISAPTFAHLNGSHPADLAASPR
jgi:hypothetical protein